MRTCRYIDKESLTKDALKEYLYDVYRTQIYILFRAHKQRELIREFKELDLEENLIKGEDRNEKKKII